MLYLFTSLAMSCSVLPSANIINCASHWHFSRPDCLHTIHAFSDFFSQMSSCHLKQKTICLIHVDKIPWNFCTSFSLSLGTFAQNWYIELGTWLDAVCMAWVFIRNDTLFLWQNDVNRMEDILKESTLWRYISLIIRFAGVSKHVH